MLADLFGVLGFLFVLFRAAILCFQTIAVGGVIFTLLVAGDSHLRQESWLQPARRLIRCASLGLVISQSLSIATNTLVLTSSLELTVRNVLGANFVIAGLLSSLAAITLFAYVRRIPGVANALLLIPAAAIVGASVMTSHSASRLDGRLWLVILTTIHYSATAAWIGGLPYLLIAMKRVADIQITARLGRNFSRLALTSVGLLLLAGFGLSTSYIGSWGAIYGTAYGLMTATKVVFFGGLLMLGAANYFLVRDMRTRVSGPDVKLSLMRFAEAEIGIGLTIILAAASLTSQPPAIDLRQDRVTLHEIAMRYAPRMPRLSSPDVRQLSEASSVVVKRAMAEGRRLPPSFVPGQEGSGVATPGDIAWSEYNHGWAGIVVFFMGILALLSRSKYCSWARAWPLMFLGLALFLFLRADPENWPLGPNSFWKSFGVADVLQHRLATILIVLFAVFEWRVQTNRVQSQRAALVFPAVCALGGVLLLTHAHSLTNIKEELLIELNHTPLAILAVIAGWSRWLEVRLPSTNRTHKYLSWVWPVCFILIGLILMDYHEADPIRPLLETTHTYVKSMFPLLPLSPGIPSVRTRGL